MMNPFIQAPEKTPGKFRVGDKVRRLYGFEGLVGEIIEDRGNLGVKGMRMYTVKFRPDEYNDHISEYPEDTLELVEAAPRNGSKPRKTK